MSIQIVPHCAELSPAVEAFNQRMRARGSWWGYFVDPVPYWIPKRPGQKVWREYYVAVDEQQAVRGGFTLKPQDWWVRGETRVVTDWQGPVSEGNVDPSYASLAVRLMREMVKRRPAIFSWGHGGADQPLVQLLRRMNWLMYETPFCLLVLRPVRFLRRNAYLRGSFLRRAILDFLALSGLGAPGFKLLHALQRMRTGRSFDARATEFAEFGAWADGLWERCKARYLAIAVRDAATMNALAPSSGWPTVIRLRVETAAGTVGWALVKDTPMEKDVRFGDLRVGSIVDCLADPEDAGQVIHAATQYLRRRGVDLIASNQSHPLWVRGFAENGYLVLQQRRLFIASPPLQEMFEPFADTARGLHLTNMDGHGPHGL